MELIPYQKVEIGLIRLFCGLIAVANILLLIVALRNIRYLVMLKIKRTSINIFYTFITAGTTFTGLTMTTMLIDPPTDYAKDWFTDFRWQSLLFRISIVISLLYGIEVYLTLQRLRLKICVHYDLLDQSQINCRKVYGLVVVGLQVSTIVAAQLAPYLSLQTRIILIASSTLISIMAYAYTAYSLVRLLNEKDRAGFRRQVDHIRMQCVGFYVSVALYSAFYFFEFSNAWQQMARHLYLIVFLFLLLICNLIPPLFHLSMHQKVYSEQVERQSELEKVIKEQPEEHARSGLKIDQEHYQARLSKREFVLASLVLDSQDEEVLKEEKRKDEQEEKLEQDGLRLSRNHAQSESNKNSIPLHRPKGQARLMKNARSHDNTIGVKQVRLQKSGSDVGGVSIQVSETSPKEKKSQVSGDSDVQLISVEI